MSDYVTPRYKINVDEDVCGNAVLCLKCVKTCLDAGHNCMGFVNKDVPETGENAPKKLEDIDHRVFAAFLTNCNGCGKCVDICPKNALSIIVPEPQLPRIIIPTEPSIIACYTLADGTVIEIE